MNPEKLKKCLLEIKKKYPDIHIQINLIIGLPYSTKEDIKESVDWFLDNNVADYLRVIDLDIRDPSRISFSSEFSKNPEKYGYQIISTDSLRYSWNNDYWTNLSAKLYAEEINKYIDSKKKDNSPFHIEYYKNQNVKTVNEYFLNSAYFNNKEKLIYDSN